jgi:mRNA interferase HigB
VRIIARRTLREFWESPGHQDSEQSLRAWFAEASKADWAVPADIKRQHRNASFVGSSRVVLNVGGNKYRLVVAIKYPSRILFIRFAGTHAQYDRIDAETV